MFAFAFNTLHMSRVDTQLKGVIQSTCDNLTRKGVLHGLQGTPNQYRTQQDIFKN